MNNEIFKQIQLKNGQIAPKSQIGLKERLEVQSYPHLDLNVIFCVMFSFSEGSGSKACVELKEYSFLAFSYSMAISQKKKKNATFTRELEGHSNLT